MASVFDDSMDDEQAPSVRVASALRGSDEEEVPEETPQAAQPQQAGTVDSSAQSYLVPAGADEGTTLSELPPQDDVQSDVPVSADTKAYATPIPAPVLAKYAPYADHSADQAALANMKAPDASKFRPSIGRRIGAGLAAGAMAFGRVPGAENEAEKIYAEPYQRAQEEFNSQRAPLLAKIDADKAADTAVDKSNAITTQQNIRAEQDFRNQSLSQQNTARAQDYQAQAEARKNAIVSFAPDDPKNPYAGGTGTTADGRTVKGVPPPDKWLANWEKNPENVAAAQAKKGVATLRALEASGVRLTPEQRAIVASGGHVTPSVHTNISILENPDGSARLPAGAAGQAGPGEVIAKNMQDKETFASQWHRVGADEAGAGLAEGSYVNVDDPTKVMSPQEFNNRIEKFRTDLNANPVMRKSGTYVNEQGQTVTNRFSRNPQVAPQAPPATAPKPQQPAAPVYKAKSGAKVTVGTPVVVDGKHGVVDYFDSKGKPHVDYFRAK